MFKDCWGEGDKRRLSGKQEGQGWVAEVTCVGMNSHRRGSCWAHLSVTRPESLLSVGARPRTGAHTGRSGLRVGRSMKVSWGDRKITDMQWCCLSISED